MQDTRLRTSLGNATVRLFRHVNRAHNRALRPLGLSAEQTHILTVLWHEGPMTIGELQRHLALGSSTLTGAIDRMEKIELVRRVPSPSDRRSVLIEPMPMESRKRRKLDAVLEATEAACFEALTKSESRQLLALLQKAADGFDE